jgi:hypothetical protein
MVRPWGQAYDHLWLMAAGASAAHCAAVIRGAADRQIARAFTLCRRCRISVSQ